MISSSVIKERRERPNRAGIIVYFGLCLLISLGSILKLPIEAEGFSGLTIGVHVTYSLLLIALILLFFSTEEHHRFLRVPGALTGHRLAVGCCIIFFVISFIVVYSQLSRFEAKHLSKDQLAFILGGLFFLVLWLIELSVKRPGFPLIMLFTASASYLFLLYFAIAQVPLISLPSEPYSLYYTVIDRFMIGLDPYQVYDTFHDHPFTALPGHWLSYLPIKLFEIDPRWVGGLAYLVSILLLYLAAPSNRKHLASYGLSLLILIPSLQLAEYQAIGPNPLMMALICFLLVKDLNLFAVAVLGLSLSISLVYWLLIPFIIGYLLAHRPLRFWLFYLALLLIFGGLLLLPFFTLSPDTFFYCTIGFWFETYLWNGPSITFWLIDFIGDYGLLFIQGFFLLFITGQFLGSEKSLAAAYMSFSVSLLFFTIVNRVSEVTFLPLIALSAIAGYIVSEGEYKLIPPVRIFQRTVSEQEIA